MQQFLAETDYDAASEIPEMQKLTEMQRRFIWEWTHNGCNASRAEALAGYTSRAGSTLLRRQDVIDAIKAVTDRMLHSSALPAVLALQEIVTDPLHKDRLKAAGMILNRTGWPEIMEHRVKVEKVPDEQTMIKAAFELAKRMGIEPAKLIGPNVNISDLEVVEALPAPLPDGSDI